MKRYMPFLILFVLITIRCNVSYADSYLMHTTKENDTYSSLSKQYATNINKLREINSNSEDMLVAGSLIKVKQIKNISIKVNDKILYTDQSPYIENSSTFVPIRFVAEALNVDKIDWDESNQTAVLVDNGKEIKLPLGSKSANINGRSIPLNAPVSVYNGRTFVPIRFIAENFSCKVYWNPDTYTVTISTNSTPVSRGAISRLSSSTSNSNANYELDVYWLSRIVHAEANGESFEGKLAVANVIINRTENPEFPKTIKEVIFDNKYGTQYTPVANGSIYNDPSSDSIEAAKQALEGNNNISECLYFLNPKTAQSSWISKNRTFYKSIGNHDFYK